MHANTASISGKPTSQIGMAYESARQRAEAMRTEHADRSFAIREVLLSMLKKSGTGRVVVSPGIAKRIVDEAKYPGQRPITPGRLYDNKRAIQDGLWNPYHAIHFALLNDGCLWLVNGQTRLTAIAECGQALEVSVVIQPVADEHEARALYLQFDQTTGVRTPNQLLNAAGVCEEYGLTSVLARSMLGAVALINNGLVMPAGSDTSERTLVSRNISNRLAWLGEWAQEGHLYADDLVEASPALRKTMYRAATVAVALLTYRHQKAKAHEFWKAVATGAQLRRNDPRLVLHTDLGNRRFTTLAVQGAVQQSAVAWNAFFNNREMRILKILDNWNVHLAGTHIGKGR